MKVLLLALTLITLTFAINVRVDLKPDDYQLYPRAADNNGTAQITGKVLETGADSAYVIVRRNGVNIDRKASKLTYTGDSAIFNFNISIPAELAEYGLLCFIDTTLIVKADSIVAGDVYLIGGQSNAVAIAPSEWREYVRAVRMNATDTGWYLAKDGTWGMEIGRMINNNYGIPVCVMNGAVSGAGIGSLQRDDNNHMNLATDYGKLLYRAFKGGVQNSVKAIFWYQGETDAGYGSEVSYPGSFNRMRNSWMENYAGVQKIYLFQINCWLTAGSREMREAHRRIAQTYDNVRIMSTIGAPTYGGHYEQPGYFEIGERMYRLVARDFYGSSDTVDVAPPQIQAARYSDASKTKVYLDFDQAIHWTGKDTAGYQLKDYFALNDSLWQIADSCWFENDSHRIVLKLKAPATATTISYMNDKYWLISASAVSGPCLMNKRNVGAITFAKYPLNEAYTTDTLAMTGIDLQSAKSTISIFEGVQLNAVSTFTSGLADTNRSVKFSTTDSSVITLNKNGFVRAINPGTSKVICSKNGFSDTLTFTVNTSFTSLEKIFFSKPTRTVMLGDSSLAELSAKISGTNLFFNIDTMATIKADTAIFVLTKGVLKPKKTTNHTYVTATLGSLSCTLAVAVKAQPSFIRRINFQPKGQSVTSIQDWLIDSTGLYTASRGFGWKMASAPSSRKTPLISNYLRSTYSWPATSGGSSLVGQYQIDCPNGNYLLRLCQCQWLWAKPGRVWFGSDTLARNNQEHAGDGIATELQIWYSDSRITVSGDSGLRLNIYGGIAYLVLASDDGGDLNLVSKDGQVTIQPQIPTVSENSNSQISLISRKPSAIPNPFNPSTTVRFTVPAGVSADYGIYDIKGRLIMTTSITRSDFVQTKNITVNFNRIKGNSCASGMYFGRLRSSDGKTFEHRLVFVR
ncbi:MAG: T9SS type A sorting domain-containing protein [Fibrobacteres bacterium]|nr:T9SS type A sorting domain-containing protein [Fibrobacterota bacterium]